MLAQHLAEVKQAIKDTPARDKAALAREKSLEATIVKALRTQDDALAKAEARLKKDLAAQDKTVIAAMQKQIEAITKLLGSGSAAVSQSGLWSKLQADLAQLATAQKDLAALNGKGGVPKASAAAAQTAASTASSAASLTAIKAQVNQQWQTLDKLYAEEKGAKGAQLTAIKDQVNAVWKVLDKLYAQENALKSGGGAPGKAAPSSGGAPSTGGGYSSVAVDRKAESDLDQILAEMKQENAQLLKILAALGKIAAEADPKAQAAAIGPAVAAAISVSGGGKTTRRG
jgi:hypothetical protein